MVGKKFLDENRVKFLGWVIVGIGFLIIIFSLAIGRFIS